MSLHEMAIVWDTLYEGNRPYVVLWIRPELWNVAKYKFPIKDHGPSYPARRRKEILEVRAGLKYLMLGEKRNIIERWNGIS